MNYAAETISTKFIGTVRTTQGDKINVFSTVSRKHVAIYPLAPSGKMKYHSIPVKVYDLAPNVRRRLGC